MPDLGSDSNSLTIGQVAELAGTPITTLRYYEKRGLLESPPRVSGQRRYERGVLMRLMVIRFCRSAGLSLEDITAVLNDKTAERKTTRSIATQRIEAIDAQIEELRLARLLMASAIQCRCASVENCTCGAMDGAVAGLLGHEQH